MRTYMHK